jgi:hypothetical protein
MADYRAGRLKTVEGSIEYYSMFRGRRPGNADYSGNERFLTISIDGQLLFTDGRTASTLDLQWRDDFGPRQTDVVIPIPFAARIPPAGATIY